VEQAAVQKILEDAQAAVDSASIKGDLRAVAFDKAIDLLAGVPAAPAPVVTSGGGGGGGLENGGDGGDGGGSTTASEKATAIAKKMHITADKVEKVYDLDEGASISLQRSKFPKDRANASAELALLYAAARQAGYGDATTDFSGLRAIADEFGVLDGGNFSGTMGKHKHWFTIKGSGKAKTAKVTNTGYEDAGKRITELLGGGS